MSAEYSVEEVREFARSVATYGNAKHTAMLIDLIERIEAGERAVPVAWMNSQTECVYETREEVPLTDGDEYAVPLFTHPPSQAAQVAQLWEMKQRACLAHALCNELRLAHPEIPELGDDGVLHEAIHDILRVDTPTAEPVSQPRSPDAADSGRVADGPLSSRLRPQIECAPWVIEEVRKLESALAAQGQGEAVAWQYRRVDDEEGPSPYWHDMTRQQYEMFRDSPRSNCEIRQLYDRPAPTGE